MYAATDAALAAARPRPSNPAIAPAKSDASSGLLPCEDAAPLSRRSCTSDGGSCNAPLEYQLTIESGFVDGSAYDTTARGPVPNPNKSAPPPPGPGLWQIHGLAKSGGTFNLLSVASVKGTEHRRVQLTARSDGGGLVVTENGGCRRTARLARG